MKRAGSGGNSSQSSTCESEEDFLLDMWDDWMGSDSEFYLPYKSCTSKLGVTFISAMAGQICLCMATMTA